MADKSHDDIYTEFYNAVNMQPKEIEQWLETEESKSVGHTREGQSESVGHKSGKKIVEIKRKKKANLTNSDFQHMNKVIGYIHRHTAQRPAGDVNKTDWAYSLKNWGYDPSK